MTLVDIAHNALPRAGVATHEPPVEVATTREIHAFVAWPLVTQCAACWGWYDDPRHLVPLLRGQLYDVCS